MQKKTSLLLLSLLAGGVVFGQQKEDKSNFKEFKPGYYQNSILKDINAVNAKIDKEDNEKLFFMDQSKMELPLKKSLYTQQWANPSLSQGNTGSCWCFATTSMYESEVKRLTGKEVKLSEIYTVYNEFIEKAKGFVASRGKSIFEQGSEGNAVTRSYKKNGIVPSSAYTGLKDGRKFHTHADMYKEMKNYLLSVKANNAWNETEVVATIKSIMNHYIGEIPTTFKVDGKEYTPMTYISDYCKLVPDDYIEVLSYKQESYWEQVEYKVPDNWWHSKEYYNVPLDVYMKVLKKAIRNGFTMSIGGDVSEAGFLRTTNAALVPSFDIPSKYINENSRQFRFSNGSTTDDHGMQLMGYYTDKKGNDWYLIKDSSSGSRNNDVKAPEFGYYFFSADYIKLKMMGFTVHKDALKKYAKKFRK
jgi:bleomycin hydrolase